MTNFVVQAEDGIRDAQESRGLGDVYKRQVLISPAATGPKLHKYKVESIPPSRWSE